MKTSAIILATILSMLSACFAQTQVQAPDSAARAAAVRDSVRMEKFLAIAQYPFIKGGKWSGVIPVADPTEVPEPNRDYKLLFEFTAKNPDSLAGEVNFGLDEVARVLNLHVASGIPASRLFPVVVIHGPGLRVITTNESYRKKFNVDNPNLDLFRGLVKAGVKFIACGQAMAFFDVPKEDLLEDVKISLTAQTVLSNYQLQGYVRYTIEPDK
jgi:intracellular sulfur oxidation DsrE/DsrF family protein